MNKEQLWYVMKTGNELECRTCKYSHRDEHEEPCTDCKNNYVHSTPEWDQAEFNWVYKFDRLMSTDK